MLFGLSNIWASFYDYIIKILNEKLNVFFIVYLNDTMIYTNEVDRSIWFNELSSS